MANRLNDDVLLHILGCLREPEFAFVDYQHSTNALAAVCLASRRLRALAQPLLYSHVWIRRVKQLELLERSEATAEYGKCTILYTAGQLASGDDVTIKTAVSKRVACLFPNLHEAYFENLTSLSFKTLEKFTMLRRLTVDDMELGQSRAATLPRLEQLYIRNCSLPKPVARKQLDPSRLPKLRILCLGVDMLFGIFEGPFSLAEVIKVVSPSFLRQLDLIKADTSIMRVGDTLANGYSPPILFELSPVHSDLPRHSVFRMRSFWDPERHLDEVKRNVDAVTPVDAEQAHVLVLPRQLYDLASAKPLVKDKIDTLVSTCEAKGVRIIWFWDETSGHESLSTPLEFWRYARELKVEQVAEGLEATRI
ncbi:hypothetical protein JCM3775_003778 [Rhodotorula graminis]